MNIVPKKPIERVQFFEGHIAPWTANATAIGTTSAAVTALATKTAAARAAYDAQKAAQDAAKAATETYRQAVEQMSLAGSAIIDQVRAAAKTSGPGVYPLAQIPAPAIPSPMGAPGKPYEFSATLGEDGALSFKWKCDNPVGCSGVLYQLYRKIGTGDLVYIGGCGSKKFTDSTLPAGAANVTYQMQAVRSTAVGPWAQFNVNFGTSGASVTESQPVKLAA